jgi:uncharacterized protein with HEPN domain
MSRDPRFYLEDILEAGSRVVTYIGKMEFQDFLDDMKTQDAVIRQFLIIGEAVKRLPTDWKVKEATVNWRAIAGFRDILAHAYFAVEESVVWDSATKHLPGLMTACRRLLKT